MGLFGQSSPFEAEIEKATSDKNTVEQWDVIMDICDKVTTNPRNAKDCLKAIQKRLAHTDPHVVIQALTLLDACVNNCGKYFHLEVASREFENEYKRLLAKAQPQVALKMRLLIKRWAENDFKADPQLNLIPSFYQKLKIEGHDFSDNQQPKQSAKAAAAQAAALRDPNVVSSQQEEDDIAKAIELSLKEAKNSPKRQSNTGITSTTTTTASTVPSTTAANSPYPSLYPTFATIDSSLNATAVEPTPEPRKVRALYDFEAAEENELTFTAGEIIHVLDDSDPNWWKGYNQRGEGLFPSNFVTADLSVEPESLDINKKNKKSVQFEEDGAGSKEDNKTDLLSEQFNSMKIEPEINEEKIDRLLHLLHEANPEDPSEDPVEMIQLEDEVNQMSPLIDAELERVDRKHAHLTQLSSDLVDAINLYHTLMREPDRSSFGGILPPGAIGPFVPPGGHFNPQPQQQPGNIFNQSQVFPLSQPNLSNFYHTSLPNPIANSAGLRNGPQTMPPTPQQLAMMQQQHSLIMGPAQTPPLNNPGSPQMHQQQLPPTSQQMQGQPPQQPITSQQFQQQQPQILPQGNNGAFSPQLHHQQQQQPPPHQIIAPQPHIIPMQYQNGHPQHSMQQQQILQQKQQQQPQQILSNPQMNPTITTTGQQQHQQNFMQPNTVPPQQQQHQNFMPPQSMAPPNSQQGHVVSVGVSGIGNFPTSQVQNIPPHGGISISHMQGQFPIQQQQLNPQQQQLNPQQQQLNPQQQQQLNPQQLNPQQQQQQLNPQQQQQLNAQQQQQIHSQNNGMGGVLSGPINGNMIPNSGIQQQQQVPLQQMNNQPGYPHPHPQQFAAINQPVTQTILGQNDPKSNIPLYQQQR